MKFKTLLIIVAICFAIVPMAVYAGISNFLVSGNSSENYDKQITSMAQNQAANLQTVLNTAQTDLKYLSESSVLTAAAKKSGSTPEAKEFVDRFQESDSIASIRLVDSDGYVILGLNSGTPVNNFDQYSQYKDGVLYFDSLAGASSSNATMFIKKSIEKCTLFISYNITATNSVLSRFTGNSDFYEIGRAHV